MTYILISFILFVINLWQYLILHLNGQPVVNSNAIPNRNSVVRYLVTLFKQKRTLNMLPQVRFSTS